jgi:hypothetical protein
MVLAVIADSDRIRARALAGQLRKHRIVALVAHDYTTATKLLFEGPRPAALYVGQSVSPLHGPDLLADMDRNANLVGLPIVAAVHEEDSVISCALTKGGVYTVAARASYRAVAALVARLARYPSDAAWRRAVLDLSQLLQARTQRAIQRAQLAMLQRERSTAPPPAAVAVARQ